jgi:hypothetical protein
VTKESRKAPTTRHAKNTLSAFGELPGAHAGSIGATPSGRPSPRTGNGRSANLQCLLLVRSPETAAAACRAGHALDCGQSNSPRPSVTAKKLHWTPPTLPVITDDPRGRACFHHKQEKTGSLQAARLDPPWLRYSGAWWDPRTPPPSSMPAPIRAASVLVLSRSGFLREQFNL